MGVRVTIQKNEFAGAAGKVRSWAGLVSQQSAYRVRDRAKQLVRVDTGELRDHITAIKTTPFSWVVSSTRPSTDGSFDVASHIEYRVESYMRPALEEERGKFADAVDRVIDSLT